MANLVAAALSKSAARRTRRKALMQQQHQKLQDGQPLTLELLRGELLVLAGALAAWMDPAHRAQRSMGEEEVILDATPAKEDDELLQQEPHDLQEHQPEQDSRVEFTTERVVVAIDQSDLDEYELDFFPIALAAAGPRDSEHNAGLEDVPDEQASDLFLADLASLTPGYKEIAQTSCMRANAEVFVCQRDRVFEALFAELQDETFAVRLASVLHTETEQCKSCGGVDTCKCHIIMCEACWDVLAACRCTWPTIRYCTICEKPVEVCKCEDHELHEEYESEYSDEDHDHYEEYDGLTPSRMDGSCSG